MIFSQVYNLLPNIELHGYFYHGLNLDDGKPDPCIPQKDMFYNGLYYIPVSIDGDGDTYDIVKVRAIKFFKIYLSSILTLVLIMYICFIIYAVFPYYLR